MGKNVLLVEDDLTIARVYSEYLLGDGYLVTHVERGGDAIAKLVAGEFDVALIDLHLPDMDGLEILRNVRDQELSLAIVVITGDGSMSNAIEAMKLGANDFLAKPFNKDRLLTTIENVLKQQNLDRMLQTYRNEIDRHEYQGFVGSSLVMQGVYRVIDSAAQSNVSVFITGESGTGKEICAEAIHRASKRADNPIVAINCGAIPKDLIESEIFGHVKGAFTGAITDRKGAAQTANGGTLFLDEICEMDINSQTKLLRFLQTGQVQPVGSNKLVDVDVRIICATNRDPMIEVAEGRFREDLYYRLHVLPVQLPALRERDNDILEVAQHFLSLYSEQEGKSFSAFSDEVDQVFRSFSWPGNIRQLQNVIRNIVVLNDGEIVDASMLPAPLDVAGSIPIPGVSSASVNQLASAAGPASISKPFQAVPAGVASIRPLAELEFEAITNALDICDGNIPKAAHYLGISAATIYRKKSAWKKSGVA